MTEKPNLTPRWREIVLQIETAIQTGELKPGMTLPSESQLSVDYAVCRMTAHRAMTELQQRGLVHRKRRVGTVVAEPSRQRTNHVAMLCFAISDFPSAAYIAGLREGLAGEYGLILCDTGEDVTREAHFLEKMRREADAIVCMPSAAPENDALLKSLSEAGIPLICLDRAPTNVDVDTIVSDNYGSSVEALRLLVARGHRRIAHLTDLRPNVSSTSERLQAHQDVLREIGVEKPEELVRFFTTFTVARDSYYPQLVREVHDALLALMHQKEPPTAIFCLQDAYMAAVLEACAKLKIEVPRQLEIVSFNDCPPQFLPLPVPVTRIVQQSHQMGVLAGESISATLQNVAAPAQIIRVAAHIFDPLS